MDRHNSSLQATTTKKKKMKKKKEMNGSMNWMHNMDTIFILFDKTDTINIIEHKTKLDEMTKNQRIQ